MDTPLTLLLAHGDAVPRRSLAGLARRLAAKLGHDVEGCLLDGPGDPLGAAVERGIERGISRFVVLSLGLARTGGDDTRADRAIARVLRRWPELRVHRGAPLDPDDLARMLGDRARETKGRAPAEDAVVVIVGGGGANPTANAELAGLARLVYEAHRFRDVDYAFLDLTGPSVGEVIGRWARLGAKLIVAVPCLVFPGRAFRGLAEHAAGAAKASPALLKAMEQVEVNGANGDERSFNERNHEGVVDDDIFFAAFRAMEWVPVKDDPLSATLPAITQTI